MTQFNAIIRMVKEVGMGKNWNISWFKEHTWVFIGRVLALPAFVGVVIFSFSRNPWWLTACIPVVLALIWKEIVILF